jgi:LPXTG-site transpeptidase (sortase) family protein
MFLFGHSTGFSVVQNKAFKVFNNLQNLKSGDTIIVHGNEGVYTYTVKTVKKVDKENALVKFDTQNNMITLSTCDSFGKASDRYVVEGDLVSVIKK